MHHHDPATFGARFLEEIKETEYGCGCGDIVIIYHPPFDGGFADASVSGSDYIHGWTEYL